VSAIYLSCAWLIGVLVGQRFHPPLASLLIGLLPLPFLFFCRRRKLIVLSSLGLLVFFGAAFYSSPIQSRPDENDLQFYNGSGAVEVAGWVSQDPEVGPQITHLRFSASEITIGGKAHQMSGTALLFVLRYPEYRYGDVLTVKGKLEVPPAFDGFDYAAFLARQDVHSVMTYPSITVAGQHKGARPLAWLFATRSSLSESIAKVLPEPQASLAQGVTLGVRNNIPPDLMDAFVRSGTAHLLAVSGVNLTIIAGVLVTLTVWLFGRRHYVYIWITLIIVWLYACLTGLQAPVLRAAIMFSFFLAADLFGRQRSGVIALFVSAAVMVGLNPSALSDASFQLSFVAMAGLVFVCPPIQSLCKTAVERLTGEGRARSVVTVATDSLSVGVGAVISTWPLISYHFGLFSWVGPLATSLALPVMAAITVTSFLAGGVGQLALPLGQAIGWLAWLPLAYLLVVVKAFSVLPGASTETGVFPAGLTAVYYTGLALVLVGYHQRQRLVGFATKAGSLVSAWPKKWVIVPLAAFAVLVWVVAATMPDDNLHVSFLDVGEGDAILIQKGEQQFLVDGGPNAQAAVLEMSKKMPFWDRSVEAVILTHPDADHLTGLVEVAKRYRVGQVFSANLTDRSALFREWADTISARHVKQTLTTAGQRISLGKDITIAVLNPPSPAFSGTESDINNNSVVLRLTYGNVSILLTGDLQSEGETALIMHRANLASTVLKVGHHGSASSTSQEFLSVVDPQVAVISVSKDNSYALPNRAVVSRLNEQLGPDNVYRTDRLGTIEFITNGKRLWVRTEH